MSFNNLFTAENIYALMGWVFFSGLLVSLLKLGVNDLWSSVARANLTFLTFCLVVDAIKLVQTLQPFSVVLAIANCLVLAGVTMLSRSVFEQYRYWQLMHQTKPPSHR